MPNVIVADDDHDVVISLTTLLEQKGFKVVATANDGEAASKMYSEHKPDVILLDLNMPNYDGHYAIEKIKQGDPNAKIVVLSAYLDKSFPTNSVTAVFSKPYEIEEVVSKLQEITSNGS